MTDDVDKVKRKRTLEKLRSNYYNAELKDVLKTYSGRAVLDKILKECEIFSNIPTDQFHTFRILGKRDVGLWLRKQILTTDYDSAILMENEARKRNEDLNI